LGHQELPIGHVHIKESIAVTQQDLIRVEFMISFQGGLAMIFDPVIVRMGLLLDIFSRLVPLGRGGDKTGSSFFAFMVVDQSFAFLAVTS